MRFCAGVQIRIVQCVCDGESEAGCGRQDEDEAYAEVAQQVRVEIRAEAAPAVVIPPLATWRCWLGGVERVAEEELARDDGVDRAVERTVQRKLEWVVQTSVETNWNSTLARY